MTFFETYGKEIFSLLVPVVTFLLNRHFKSKAKLLVALPHQFTFLVQQPLLNEKGEVISSARLSILRSFWCNFLSSARLLGTK